MKKVLFTMILGISLALVSCGGGSVEDYADKFCKCLKDKGDDCESILKEARKKFPDGEEAFKKKMDECDLGE